MQEFPLLYLQIKAEYNKYFNVSSTKYNSLKFGD